MRLATVSESRESPRRVPWKAAGVSLVSEARVSIDLASRPVLIASVREASPENACTTSYADLVRDSGIVESFCS